MAEGQRKVRGVGFGDIFSGKKEINLRTTAGRSDEASDNVRSIVIEKPEITPLRARCVFEYNAEFEDELPLAVGDIVNVLDRDLEDEGWWKGQLVSNGRIGVFPNNFTELITDDDATPPTRAMVDVSQPKLAENAPSRTPEAPLLLRKAPATEPPALPAKTSGRPGAPPVSTKPKGTVKPDNPTLAQSNSVNVVNTPIDSVPTLNAVKPNEPRSTEPSNSNPSSIRERLGRLNFLASASNHPPPASPVHAPAPVNTSVQAAPAPAPTPVLAPVPGPAPAPASVTAQSLGWSLSLRKNSADKTSISAKKADDTPRGVKFWKKKSGSASKDDPVDQDSKAEIISTASTSTLPSDEHNPLQSLTKGRPKVPRLFRKMSKNAGRAPSQAIDDQDYTLPDDYAPNSTDRERPNDSVKPSANGETKRAAVATEISTSTASNQFVTKHESDLELTPPVFDKETPLAAVANYVPMNASQPQRPAVAATSSTAFARPAPAVGDDETMRLNQAIIDLRRELTTLRDENLRLDRRLTVLERELDEERRARHTLAIEVDELRSQR